MDRTEKLASEIRAFCAAHANPKNAARWNRYFTEGYDAWGLDSKDPFWTTQQETWLKEYGDLELNGFLRLGQCLFATGKYEEGGLAIRFVKHYRDEFDAKALAHLATWFEAGIRNWAHTDVLCGEVISPLLQSGRLKLSALAKWRDSKWKYQRRAVPVAMLGLLKTKHEIAGLLKFVRPLMRDPERVVHQGLGWFLREAWKAHPREVEAFLLEWKEEAPRLIFQYATEKMSPEHRARFRRQKKP